MIAVTHSNNDHTRRLNQKLLSITFAGEEVIYAFFVEAITDASRTGRFAEAENGKWGRFIGGIQLFCLQPSGDMDRCPFCKCKTRWLCASDVRVPLYLLLKTNMLSESCDYGVPSNAIFYYFATYARTHASTHVHVHTISAALCAAINSWKKANIRNTLHLTRMLCKQKTTEKTLTLFRTAGLFHLH